jgi:RNA polymerase sigma factor (sigma-70 family)
MAHLGNDDCSLAGSAPEANGRFVGKQRSASQRTPSAILVLRMSQLGKDRGCMTTGFAFEQILREARDRWPAVCWDQGDFRSHLIQEHEDGPPKFAVDLYLAGAAGFRVEEAWEAIETEMGTDARRILSSQPIADCTVEDLWSEALVKLMANDDQRALLPSGRSVAKIIRYRGRIRLLFYIVVIAKRHAINRNRVSRRQQSLTRMQDDNTVDMPVMSQEIPPGDLAASSEIAQGLRDKIRIAIESLTTEQRFLVAMVYRNGMKQKEAGAMLGFSEFKTSRHIKDAMERLRERLIAVYENQWTPSLEAAWVGCWAESWADVQVPSPGMSSDIEKKE